MSLPEEQIAQLIELQKIDTELVGIVKEIKDIPRLRQEMGVDYLELKAEHEALNESIENSEKERVSLESDLKMALVDLEGREKRIFSIKTPKEYQAAVREVAQVKKENKDREEKILKLLEQVEAAKEKSAQLSQPISEKKSEFDKLDLELKEKESSLKDQEALLKGKRPALVANLDANMLNRYDTIKEIYDDAVVPAIKATCMGCHMSVRPQLYNEMLKSRSLNQCPYCQRIMYAKVEQIQTESGQPTKKMA